MSVSTARDMFFRTKLENIHAFPRYFTDGITAVAQVVWHPALEFISEKRLEESIFTTLQLIHDAAIWPDRFNVFTPEDIGEQISPDGSATLLDVVLPKPNGLPHSLFLARVINGITKYVVRAVWKGNIIYNLVNHHSTLRFQVLSQDTDNATHGVVLINNPTPNTSIGFIGIKLEDIGFPVTRVVFDEATDFDRDYLCVWTNSHPNPVDKVNIPPAALSTLIINTHDRHFTGYDQTPTETPLRGITRSAVNALEFTPLPHQRSNPLANQMPFDISVKHHEPVAATVTYRNYLMIISRLNAWFSALGSEASEEDLIKAFEKFVTERSQTNWL